MKLSLARRAIQVVGIDPGTFDSVSQNGHLLAGSWSVFMPIALFGVRWQFVGAAMMTMFALWKEFWYDERYETPDVRGSSLEDFLHYVAGVVVSMMVYWAIVLL